MSAKDGGPAFPSRESNEHVMYPDRMNRGMTLRDYFAAKAMHMALAGLKKSDFWSSEGANQHARRTAIEAYRYADAMLEAREGK